MRQDQIVTCGECGGKSRIPAGAAQRGARARCGHCGAYLAIPIEGGADPALVRPAVLEPSPPVSRRRGRWFLGFLTGAVAATAALYFVDRRTDLQSIQFDRIDVPGLVGRYWPEVAKIFRAESPPVADPETPAEAPPSSAAESPAEPAAPEPVPEPQIIQSPPPPAPDPEPPVELESGPPAAPPPDPDDQTLLEPLPDAAPDPAPAPDPALAFAPPAADEAAPLPVSVDQGILFNNTGREGLAPLNIVTSPDWNYFVKLVDTVTGESAVGIYVSGGSVAEFDVPLGSYEVRYASGSTWYGEGDLFGPETQFAKADDIFNFTEDADGYVGYTLTLIMREGGNLSTSSIPPDAF